jgi:hypothetical protein
MIARLKEELHTAKAWNAQYQKQLTVGPKLATRGGEWEPIKISSEIDPSAYIPKSPQALEPRSARIAMDKLSRNKRPRLQRGSKGERNFTKRSTSHPDRSDRCTGPV